VCAKIKKNNSGAKSLRTTKLNIQQSYVLPTHCIYVLLVYLDIRTNSDYFPIEH